LKEKGATKRVLLQRIPTNEGKKKEYDQSPTRERLTRKG